MMASIEGNRHFEKALLELVDLDEDKMLDKLEFNDDVVVTSLRDKQLMSKKMRIFLPRIRQFVLVEVAEDCVCVCVLALWVP